MSFSWLRNSMWPGVPICLAHTQMLIIAKQDLICMGCLVSSLAGKRTPICFQRKHWESQISLLNDRKERTYRLIWIRLYFLRMEYFITHKVTIETRRPMQTKAHKEWYFHSIQHTWRSVLGSAMRQTHPLLSGAGKGWHAAWLLHGVLCQPLLPMGSLHAGGLIGIGDPLPPPTNWRPHVQSYRKWPDTESLSRLSWKLILATWMDWVRRKWQVRCFQRPQEHWLQPSLVSIVTDSGVHRASAFKKAAICVWASVSLCWQASLGFFNIDHAYWHRKMPFSGGKNLGWS